MKLFLLFFWCIYAMRIASIQGLEGLAKDTAAIVNAENGQSKNLYKKAVDFLFGNLEFKLPFKKTTAPALDAWAVTPSQKQILEARRNNNLDVTSPQAIAEMRAEARARDIEISNDNARRRIPGTKLRKPRITYFDEVIDSHSAVRAKRIAIQTRIFGRKLTPSEELELVATTRTHLTGDGELGAGQVTLHEKLAGRKLTKGENTALFGALKYEYSEGLFLEMERPRGLSISIFASSQIFSIRRE